jgi:DNA-binding response OmpR family regulator
VPGEVMRILMIEHDREFAEDLLAVWSPPSRVRLATTSQEALSALVEERPDLILLGTHLPHDLTEVDEEEGFRLLTCIRLELGRRTPVLVITRERTEETLRRAAALGADEVLLRPVDVATLERLVARLVPEARGRPLAPPGS